MFSASAHNDDDNMILGLAINKDYKDENISLECGEIETRVSPCCILMCITVDGKFCMFHFARYFSFFCLVSGGCQMVGWVTGQKFRLLQVKSGSIH